MKYKLDDIHVDLENSKPLLIQPKSFYLHKKIYNQCDISEDEEKLMYSEYIRFKRPNLKELEDSILFEENRNNNILVKIYPKDLLSICINDQMIVDTNIYKFFCPGAADVSNDKIFLLLPKNIIQENIIKTILHERMHFITYIIWDEEFYPTMSELCYDFAINIFNQIDFSSKEINYYTYIKGGTHEIQM